MRTIKFRAWYCNEMLYDYISNVMDYDSWGAVNDDSFQVHRDIVLQQFTGLHDKNGKEIYEGDIYHQGEGDILYIVECCGACFLGRQNGNQSKAGLEHFLKDIEVIGNIYENKELLK